jgi:hypothetical protein
MIISSVSKKKPGKDRAIYFSYMNTYRKYRLINANTAIILTKWLEKWEIPYDEIVYGSHGRDIWAFKF